MSPIKILLVDDIELFLKVEKTFLEREGITLLVARSGQEALDMVRSEQPQLVFMDLYMPVMDGDEACQIIKSDPQLAATPVVMVTWGNRHEDTLRCQASRCDDIILKPLDQKTFLETARKYLGIPDRATARVAARLKVRSGLEGDRLLSHYSINISTGGLFLEIREPLPAATPLVLEFTLPDRFRPIQCRARVAWVNPAEAPKKPDLPPGMGIQFIDLPLADMHEIREFMKSDELAPQW